MTIGRTTQTNMKLFNPTKEQVSITILGISHKIAPLSLSNELSQETGMAWLKIHEFLEIKEDEPEQVIVEKDVLQTIEIEKPVKTKKK